MDQNQQQETVAAAVVVEGDSIKATQIEEGKQLTTEESKCDDQYLHPNRASSKEAEEAGTEDGKSGESSG